MLKNVCLIFKYDVQTECSLHDAFLSFKVLLSADCQSCMFTKLQFVCSDFFVLPVLVDLRSKYEFAEAV